MDRSVSLDVGEHGEKLGGLHGLAAGGGNRNTRSATGESGQERLNDAEVGGASAADVGAARITVSCGGICRGGSRLAMPCAAARAAPHGAEIAQHAGLG